MSGKHNQVMANLKALIAQSSLDILPPSTHETLLASHDAPDAALATISQPLDLSKEILVLCDLDGTMLEPEPEAHISAHLDALREIFQVDIARDSFWDAADNGMTDREIASCLLGFGGYDLSTVTAEQALRWEDRIGQFFDLYLAWGEWAPEVLPHVRRGLERASSISNIRLDIATGNVERIARGKLEITNLAGFFPPGGGGFGGKCVQRRDLLIDVLKFHGVIQDEKELSWDGGVPASKGRGNIFLLGDTVRDMESAQSLGIRPVGVATGAQGWRELKKAGAEVVFVRFDRAVEWVLEQTVRTWTQEL